jgi:hypothetical protein
MEDRTMQGRVRPEVRTAIREELARRHGQARFVVEIAGTLRGLDADPDEIEAALEQLERDGTILVRVNACADPHLEGSDLRLAALIESSPCDCEDSTGAAVIAIEKTWERWLTEYLANHRCM